MDEEDLLFRRILSDFLVVEWIWLRRERLCCEKKYRSEGRYIVVENEGMVVDQLDANESMASNERKSRSRVREKERESQRGERGRKRKRGREKSQITSKTSNHV